jgi:hypothetical protein
VAPEPFDFPSYTPPAPYEKPEDFSYGEFVAPSADTLLGEDPGYQFRFGEGLRALEARAAQRGTLRGGRTLKGLIDYGQEAASQEYGKAYDRRRQDYLTNRATAAGAYDVNLGAGQYAYGANVGAAQDAYNIQRQNAYQNELMNRESAFNAYTTNLNNMYTQARDRYAPELLSWNRQQEAAESAARAKYDRQWDAYRYSQPSGSNVFNVGAGMAGQ